MGTVLLVLPQILVSCIKHEKISIKLNKFLLLSFLLPISFLFLPEAITNFRIINFMQHSIGGGVAVGLVGIYLIESFKSFFVVKNISNPYLKYLGDFSFQITFIYMLVSSLGVVNELLEFALDTSNIGIFSADRYDTWFDLLANTSGALIVFLFYKLVSGIYLLHKSQPDIDQN